jgi:DNA-binding transcriptional ArsR family regulator
MATQRSSRPSLEPKSITPERAARLYRLVQLVGSGSRTRATLTRRLGLDIRAFYRDLDLLRSHGIALLLHRSRYALEGPVEDALARLPFPDPCLSLGEVRRLAKGRTAAHRKLQERVAQFLKAHAR